MLIFERIRQILHNEEGQGLVEYALILTLIAVVVVGVMSTMGINVAAFFSTVSL